MKVMDYWVRYLSLLSQKKTSIISLQIHRLMQLFKMQQSFKIPTWKWKNNWIKNLEKGNATFRKTPSTTRGAYTTKTVPQKIHGNWFISSYYSPFIKFITLWNSSFSFNFYKCVRLNYQSYNHSIIYLFAKYSNDLELLIKHR